MAKRHRYSLPEAAQAMFGDCPDHIAEDMKKSKDPKKFVVDLGMSYYDRQQKWLKKFCGQKKDEFSDELNEVFFDLLKWDGNTYATNLRYAAWLPGMYGPPMEERLGLTGLHRSPGGELYSKLLLETMLEDRHINEKVERLNLSRQLYVRSIKQLKAFFTKDAPFTFVDTYRERGRVYLEAWPVTIVIQGVKKNV